jgi:hypothetical protein
MTVAQLLEMLVKMPEDAVVLMENGVGFSSVSSLEFVASQGLGAPAEVLLLPNMEE